METPRQNLLDTPVFGHSEIRSAPPPYADPWSNFSLFPNLPSEIRLKIWEAALRSRIVRWIRKNDRNVFTAPSRSLPLLAVSREAREAAFLYGGYQNMADSSNPVYFSPKIDYLWFDPGWIELFEATTTKMVDPLDPALPDLSQMRNIIVHPNWSETRRRPAVSFGKLPMVEKVLVAADEKSLGFQSKVMLETVKDIKSYYAALRAGVQDGDVAVKTPYVAVGCVGWIGEERRKIHHGSEDNRQLVKIFELKSEMNAHMSFLREEEWRFTHDRFDRPKIAHKLRWARERRESAQESSSPASKPDRAAL